MTKGNYRKSLAANATAPKLQTSKNGGAATAAPTAPNDPRGFKTYIAWSVAFYLFPDGDGVNLNQDISDNAKANSDALALDINYYAYKLAIQYRYTWTNVPPTDVAKLGAVSDLEKLVINNLS